MVDATRSDVQLQRSTMFGPRVMGGGALAGVLAGLVMGLVATLRALVTSSGVATPWQTIAGTFFGPMAYVGGAGSVAVGIVTHAVASAVIGVIFAALVDRIQLVGRLVVLGICYGIIVWAVMTYLLVPVFNATLYARIPLMNLPWFVMHIIYGASMGVFVVPLRRAFTQASPEPEAQELPQAARAKSA